MSWLKCNVTFISKTLLLQEDTIEKQHKVCNLGTDLTVEGFTQEWVSDRGSKLTKNIVVIQNLWRPEWVFV